MIGRLCLAMMLIVALLGGAAPSHAMSVSLADSFFPTYGQARHLEQYNEYLGLDGQTYDGASWTGPALPGGVFELTLSPTVGDLFGAGDYEYLGVWIDWNQDRFWGESERVLYLEDHWFDLGTNDLQFGINVPNAAVGGQTWMRIRFGFDGPLDPTGDAWTGEVEDYLVNVAPEPSVLALLGLGLAGIVVLGRRRRR